MTLKAKVLMGLMGFSLSFGCGVSVASDLGHYGQVFPVIEEDLRLVIINRLKAMQQSGELEAHQQVIQERVAAGVVRPKPLNLTTTKTPKTFHVDPSVVVSHDIYLPDGTLVAKAGTVINPFNRVNFSKTLFFFNNDDLKQVAWVKRHYQDYNHVKFILTGGDIRQAATDFGRIYFDVNGLLTTKLQIRHVPSVVIQEGKVWQVKEIGGFDA